MTRSYLSSPATIFAFALIATAAAHQGREAGTAPQPAPDAMKAAQIVDAYVQAVGGRQAFERLTSRVTKGTWENVAKGVKARFTLFAQAPDRYLFVLEDATGGKMGARGYDGRTGWSFNLTETGLRELNGTELSSFRRAMDFYREIRLRELFPTLTFKGQEKIAGHDAYVLEGVPPGGLPERFYFDAQTGLLVRHDETYQTSRGHLPAEQYFDDYREVDGVKLPFKQHTSTPAFEIILRVTEVSHNVPLDTQKFGKPSY